MQQQRRQKTSQLHARTNEGLCGVQRCERTAARAATRVSAPVPEWAFCLTAWQAGAGARAAPSAWPCGRTSLQREPGGQLVQVRLVQSLYFLFSFGAFGRIHGSDQGVGLVSSRSAKIKTTAKTRSQRTPHQTIQKDLNGTSTLSLSSRSSISPCVLSICLPNPPLSHLPFLLIFFNVYTLHDYFA